MINFDALKRAKDAEGTGDRWIMGEARYIYVGGQPYAMVPVDEVLD